MEWATWAGTFGAKIGAKTGGKLLLNACVPGLGSAVDFGEAAICLCKGDLCGATINTVSGVADLVSFGIAGTAKEAMKESAKGAVVQSAKDAAKSATKEATRKVGQDFGKQLAMGATTGGKDAAIKMVKAAAQSASKEATRKVGQQVGKELAKGVTTEAVEEVFQEGTKMTLKKLILFSAVSSGGKQVWQTILEDLGEKSFENLIFKNLFQQNPKIVFDSTIFEAAKKGAEEELKKRFLKFFAKDVAVSALKGTIRYFQAKIENKTTNGPGSDD